MYKKSLLSGSFCLMLACMVLTLPLQWIIAAVTAAVFHELCHYIAARLLGGRVDGFFLSGYAAGMPVSGLSNGKELLCALAGPLGGFLLCFLTPIFPRIAFSACLQSLYNLLPLYPQDGGRAIRCLAFMLLPPSYACWLCSFITWLCIGALLSLGLYGTFAVKLGFLPLLLSIAIAVKAFYTCKEGQIALQ